MEPTRRATESAGWAFEPAGMALEPARRTSKEKENMVSGPVEDGDCCKEPLPLPPTDGRKFPPVFYRET